MGYLMHGRDLIEGLRHRLSLNTDTQVATILGVTSGRVSQIANTKALTPREVTNMVARVYRSAGQPIDGRDFLGRLRQKLGLKTDRQVAAILGVTPGRVSQIAKKEAFTSSEVANMVVRAHQASAKPIGGLDLVDRLRRELGLKTDWQLSDALGVTPGRISQLSRKNAVTSREIANMIGRTRKTARIGAISPVVERYPIEKVPTKQRVGHELFDLGVHPYRIGLRNELKQHHGVYVFYDSSGCALYVGKAAKQKLWEEMKNAFNRARDTQKVFGVRHPARRRGQWRRETRVTAREQLHLHIRQPRFARVLNPIPVEIVPHEVPNRHRLVVAEVKRQIAAARG